MVEELHQGAVAVVSPAGRTVATFGEVDRPFFIRSAAKPFQARVALDVGVELEPVQLALACASHSGQPVHVAVVESILSRYGLTVSTLACPPSRPAPSADRRLAAAGNTSPDPRYHGCSGKHAVMLAACVVAGWPTVDYLDPAHPLQARIGAYLAEVTGAPATSPGVDGCGAPVWTVTTKSLAFAYSRLGTDPALAEAGTAMARYPRLVGGEGEDADIAVWLGIPVKVGAAGCMAASVHGYGIAAKAWSGRGSVAAIGILLGLDHLGVLTSCLRERLDHVRRPLVYGGGREVGRYRVVAGLEPV